MFKRTLTLLLIIIISLGFSACGGSGKADGEWERFEYVHVEYDVMTSWGEVISEDHKIYLFGPDAGKMMVFFSPRSYSMEVYDEPYSLGEYVLDFFDWDFFVVEFEGTEYELISANKTIVDEMTCYELEYTEKGGGSESVDYKVLFVQKYYEGGGFWMLTFEFVLTDKADAAIYDHVKSSIH